MGNSFDQEMKDWGKKAGDVLTGRWANEEFDIKENWDKVRGATKKKEAAKAAKEAAALKASYEEGAKRKPPTEKDMTDRRGARGTRLVRQPLGSFTGA